MALCADEVDWTGNISSCIFVFYLHLMALWADEVDWTGNEEHFFV